MSNDEGSLAERVAEIPWYHSIELPDGIVTPGVNASSRALSRLGLPESLTGKSVLDIGAWDGFYSFESHRRGAERVLATDSFVWLGHTWGGTGKRGFMLAREALSMTDKVEDKTVDVMDLSPDTVGGRFDVVLFLGVLYHMRDPYGAIARVASVCADMLIMETVLSVNWLPFPAAQVYAGSELNNDESNWFAFNVAALRSMLRSQGFTRIDVVYKTPLWKSILRSTARTLKLPGSRRLPGQSRRIVIHAHM